MTDAPPNADPTTGEITDDASVDDEAAIRSFATFLHQQRYGAFAVECSEALNTLIAAVQEHGKGGSLSLTFKVKPAGKGKDRRILQITDEVTTKLPEGERESSLFYATDSNGLSREDPRQGRLPLAEVPKPAVVDAPDPAEIREVN